MDSPGLILVVDDDDAHRRLTARWLERAGHRVIEACSGGECLARLGESLPDVVLLDLHLEDENGLDILDRLQHQHAGLPVLMLTAERDVETVVSAMQRGAWDYLTKPMGRPKLTATVRNAVAHRRMRLRLHDLEREASENGFGELIGNSEPMKRVYREITRLAQSEITVLVFGESGTGKELVARALHDHSGRSRAPFVALNCAAVPENLQESELFGHEKGTFTGAEERRIGRFEQADGGTLFLDEVGELSPGLQAKLLRVLQERRITRVGGSREFEVDVRVVAATHIDLLEAVEAGSFRQDLYFRLAVYEMELPALRERGDDIIELAMTFARVLTPPERPVPELAPELQALLRAYGWPGNVRELKNAIHRALVAADGQVLTVDALPPRMRRQAPQTQLHALPPVESQTMDDIERDVIIRVLDETGGNVSEVIRRLGIPRTTLYRKLKAYGLR
jgi:two-component system response regulator HydG